MVERERDRRLRLSLSDPDLNLVEGVNEPQHLLVTLGGHWRISKVVQLHGLEVPDGTASSVYWLKHGYASRPVFFAYFARWQSGVQA